MRRGIAGADEVSGYGQWEGGSAVGGQRDECTRPAGYLIGRMSLPYSQRKPSRCWCDVMCFSSRVWTDSPGKLVLGVHWQRFVLRPGPCERLRQPGLACLPVLQNVALMPRPL